VASNVHNGDTIDLPDAPLQVLVICGDHVALMLFDPVDQAVISVGAGVKAGESLKTWVLSKLESQSVAMTHFLQLSDGAVCYAWYALSQQAV